MKTKFVQRFSIVLMLLVGMTLTSGAQTNNQGNNKTQASEQKDSVKYKVTFIELGSVRCIPCQKMQPVMKAIEEKYGDQVKVEFHDVWTPNGKPFADKYDIKAIPTQVLLDENGKEFFRHEGYFSEEELVTVLKQKNVR